MAFLTLMLVWLVLVMLGIAAIVAAEPLWKRVRLPALAPSRERRRPALQDTRELPCPGC